MLRKKTNGVATGPRTSSFIGKATEKVVDRRAFLKGSGLAVGGLATAAALVGSNVKPVQAAVSSAAVVAAFDRVVKAVLGTNVYVRCIKPVTTSGTSTNGFGASGYLIKKLLLLTLLDNGILLTSDIT